MLPFKNRIIKRNDFKRVFGDDKLLFSEIMIIRFLENKLDRTRFGFIVSKKVSPSAVKRNRVKRILREQIRLRLPKFTKGFDIIIIAKKNIIEKNFKEIGFVLEELFLKEKILLKNKN